MEFGEKERIYQIACSSSCFVFYITTQALHFVMEFTQIALSGPIPQIDHINTINIDHAPFLMSAWAM